MPTRWRLPTIAWIALFLGGSVVVAFVDIFGGDESTAIPAVTVDETEVIGDEQELLVTGYCNCGKCCVWRK